MKNFEEKSCETNYNEIKLIAKEIKIDGVSRRRKWQFPRKIYNPLET